MPNGDNKLLELKDKYEMSDEDFDDFIMNSPLPPEEPRPLTRGKPRGGDSLNIPKSMDEYDPLFGLLTSGQGFGNQSMTEMLGMVIVMDYLDRIQERKDLRKSKGEDTTGLDQVIDMLEKRIRASEDKFMEYMKESEHKIEKLVLGKELEETREEARKLSSELTRRDEVEQKRREQEALLDYVDERISQATQHIQQIPQAERKGFFDELVEDLGNELQSEVKEYFVGRLRGEEPADSRPPITVDEAGNTKLDYMTIFDRTYKLADKYIETIGRVRANPPPLKPVTEVQPQPGFQEDDYIPSDLQIESPSQDFQLQQEETPQQVVEPSSGRYRVEPAEIEKIEQPVREPRIHIPEKPPKEDQPETPAPIPPEPRYEEPQTRTNLKDISGIGPARASTLQSIGVESVEHLMETDSGYIAEELNVSPKIIEDWKKQAGDLKAE
jgi:predicted flap endonuclease-1-like 5' DNA nuclease